MSTFREHKTIADRAASDRSRHRQKIEKAIIDAYDVLSNEEDRELFYDYLITNVKLYFDRFENELEPMVDEPSTPEYDEKISGEEREEDFKLEEYIDLDGLLEGIHR